VFDCQLTGLRSDIFATTPYIEEIFLYGNRITRLSQGLFNGLTNLNLLSLYENSITSLPLGLGLQGSKSLQTLRLHSNRITALNGQLQMLSNLTVLFDCVLVR
jgi:Leucine-rich repeat (LRR) protein